MIRQQFSRLTSPLPHREGLGVGLLLLLLGSASLMAQDDPFGWASFNPYQWPSSMTLTCHVRLGGEVLGEEAILAAYCGNELRGIDRPWDDGKYQDIVYLDIYGEYRGDKIHFKVYTGGRVIEVDQGLVYANDAIVGKPSDPYYVDLPEPVTTTFSAEGWATTCLPFNAEVPEGITVWNATGIANGELVMEKCVGNIMPKDTPFLLQGEGGANCEWLARVTDGNVNASGSIFCGTTKPTTVDAGSILTLGHSEDTGEIGFWRFIGTTVPANRAYIDDVPSEARGVRIRIDNDDTTEIDDVIANPSPSLSIWYSIDGQRLSCKPSQNGIYVLSNSDSLQGKNNGRKVLIKK